MGGGESKREKYTGRGKKTKGYPEIKDESERRNKRPISLGKGEKKTPMLWLPPASSTKRIFDFKFERWNQSQSHSKGPFVRAQDKTTPNKIRQGNTRQGKTGQDNTTQHNTTPDKDNTRHGETRQDKTRQHNTTQYNTTQDKTRQDKTRQDHSRQDKITQHNTTQHNNKRRQGAHIVVRRTSITSTGITSTGITGTGTTPPKHCYRTLPLFKGLCSIFGVIVR